MPQDEVSRPPGAGPEADPGAAPPPAVDLPAVDPPAVDLPMTEAETEAYIRFVKEALREGDFTLLGRWVAGLLRTPEFWLDAGLIVLSVIVARWIFGLLRKGRLPTVQRFVARIPAKRELPLLRILMLLTAWLALLVVNGLEAACPLLRTYSLVLALFVFFALPSRFLRWKSWMSFASAAVFVVATLHVLGLLGDAAAFLEGYAMELGDATITLLGLLKGAAVLLVLFWAAGLTSRLLSRKIERVEDLTPNVKLLFTKGLTILLFTVALLAALGVMGVRATTLTVFGGALGLGLGFGLQKVVSNLVSGVILLLDKSIKPGDVIEVAGTYGWINSLNLRYASVITRDNKEHLIPNEDLITSQVVNWSFSSKLVRIRAPIGISYGSDLRLAMDVATRCAERADRVVADPPPRCNLVGFGDSSVDLELRYWIADPESGVGQVTSNVLLSVWDAFHENGISFPFPQRDVHLRVADAGELRPLLDGPGKPPASE